MTRSFAEPSSIAYVKGQASRRICAGNSIAGLRVIQTTGQVQAGRRALLVNDPEAALPYFLEAAKRDPKYVYISEDFREGIWTYVGRAQYATKRYQDARQSLEHALTNDRDDNLARLYYGLTLVRLGDSARGVKEIESAMQGIHDWLEYMERSRAFRAFWDPLREIRRTIENDLDRTPSKDLARENLIAVAEWLGNKMEIEIERVRQDERRQYEREFERGRGPVSGHWHRLLKYTRTGQICLSVHRDALCIHFMTDISCTTYNASQAPFCFEFQPGPMTTISLH